MDGNSIGGASNSTSSMGEVSKVMGGVDKISKVTSPTTKQSFKEKGIGATIGGYTGKAVTFLPALIVSNIKACVGKCNTDEKDVREDAKKSKITKTGDKVGSVIGYAVETGITQGGNSMGGITK